MSMKEVHAPGLEYRRDVGGNYLVLKGYVDDYRVHMLEHNRIPGLLRVSLNEDDSSQDIRYEVGSWESLRHILDARNMTGENVGRIISDLMRTVRELGTYMLNKDDILLDPEYMYLDDDKNLMLCYVPNNAVGLGLGLSELLRSMLAAVDNNDHDSVVLTYSLYQESLRENYVIDDLMKIIRSNDARSRKKDAQMQPELEAALAPDTVSDDVEEPDENPYERPMREAVAAQVKVAEPDTGGFFHFRGSKAVKGQTKVRKLFRIG